MFSYLEIIKITKAKLLFTVKEKNIKSVSIDSRNIQENELFIAIKGEVFDGHNFIEDIILKNVSGIIIDEKKLNENLKEKIRKSQVACFLVKNTLNALFKLAKYNKQKSNTKLIAITGSSGKTTVKELTKSIFNSKFKTLASEKSFNNHIGVPLTLLKLNKTYNYAIIEMGMNHFGEINKLSKIANPDIALITNIGTAHIGILGSQENIGKAKFEIFNGLKKDGKAILNADDKIMQNLAKNLKFQTLNFGLKKATLSAKDIIFNGEKSSFTLISPIGEIKIPFKIPANFMVLDILAAATIAFACGFSLKEIKNGLKNFQTAEGRMQILKSQQGFNVVNDSYNANPSSISASLNAIKNLKGKNNSFFVMGDMLELGDKSKKLHQEIGEKIAFANFKKVYLTGNFALDTKKGLNKENFKEVFIGTKDEIYNDIIKNLKKGDFVLVKGSRTMKMETIVSQLTMDN